jgi:putative flippase GtrA
MIVDSLLKLARFGVVGTIGVGVDFGITWICKEKLSFNKFIANTCGFTLAVVNNYILNRLWTFQSTNRDWQPEFARFVLFALIGLLLNNVLLWIFNERLHTRFYLAKAAAIACVFVWNFFSNFLFNFH